VNSRYYIRILADKVDQLEERIAKLEAEIKECKK